MSTIIAKDITGGSSPTPTPEPTPVLQTPPTPEPSSTKPNPEEAARFAQLAKREKMLRNRAVEIEKEKQALASQKAELDRYKSESEKFNAWREKLTSNPLEVLTQAGLTSDQAVQLMLNPQSMTEQTLMSVNKRIQELENKLVTKEQEQTQAAYSQAIKQIRTEVKMMVQGSPEFETISNMNAQEAVVELIKLTFDKEGYVMNVEDAAKEVEEYLVEQAIKIANSKKIKEKMNQSPNQTPVQKPGQTPQTLTHNMQQQSKPLTQKDRRERAIAAFKGTLTS